jgi:hypothetical protein
MTSLNPIEAHERSVGQIFSDNYAFEIPPYQRPYAWQLEQARELLSDLMDAAANSTSAGGVYFLGSVVLIKAPTTPQSKVVDGQQRLTTLTILLAVLRDLTSDPEMKMNRSNLVYQKANPDSGTQDRYRVLLRPQDQVFFAKHIQAVGASVLPLNVAGLTGSQQRIAENSAYFQEKLMDISEGERNKLVAFLVQRCYVVVVAVSTAEAARRIFTVLNARGLDLTATDILKADLLERASRSQEKNLASRWEAVEQALGRDKMVELFGHIRMMFEREKPRIALESGFRRSVTPFNGEAESFIGEVLEPIADAFLLLSNWHDVEKQFGSEAAKAVRSLDRIDSKDWVPPVLLRLWRRQPNDGAAIAKFLICIERLAYFLFVTRLDVNARIERFAQTMDDLHPLKVDHVFRDALALTSHEQAKFLIALSGPLYTVSRVCKPVMQRLDEALSTGGASYDKLVSIEHVLPQTVDGTTEWATLFPLEDQRVWWMHRLANLVFLTRRINIKASNWDFSKKKEKYFASEDGSSPFVITQGVLQTAQWSPEHLLARQSKLIAALAKVWSLDLNFLNLDVSAESEFRRVKAELGIGEDEGSWRSDILAALKLVGGSAHLDAIYSTVYQLRSESGRSLPASYKSLVRKNLEQHSSDSDAFTHRFDVFKLVEKGSGVWSIRQDGPGTS